MSNETPSIAVTCDAGTCVEEGGAPSLVTRFGTSRAAHFIASSDMDWHPNFSLDPGARARDRGVSGRMHKRVGRDTTDLLGTRPLTASERLQIDANAGPGGSESGPVIRRENGVEIRSQVRSRHNIRCGKCGDSVPLRQETANSVFGALFDSGLDSITLTGLRRARDAILQSK